MARGGKEEIILPENVQGWVSYAATKKELDNWKSFGNQLLDVVRLSDPKGIYWLNEYPKEIKEEHLVHLLNIIREMVRCPKIK